MQTTSLAGKRRPESDEARSAVAAAPSFRGHGHHENRNYGAVASIEQRVFDAAHDPIEDKAGAPGTGVSIVALSGLPVFNAQTMSSREIADLTGSKHDNVLKSIRSLIAKGLVSRNETPYVHPQNGQTYFEYSLSYRDTMVVVSGYSDVLRAKIIDRWQKLEAGQVPRTFSAALMLAAKQQEQIEQQQAALTAAAPKVEYADALLNADDTVLIRDAAKTIGVPERKLHYLLKRKGVVLGNNAPAAHYVKRGYFRQSAYTYETRTRGTQIGFSARVTGRGIEFIRRLVKRNRDLLFGHDGAAEEQRVLL